jgi:hypothetical protein
MSPIDDRPAVQSLFSNLKASGAELEALLGWSNGHWIYEDGPYRFYHQSFKVFALQQSTLAIASALQALAPDRKLNDWFSQIVSEGTGQEFEHEHNRQWLSITRPIVEAFFHSRFFLEMAVRYGKDLDAPPTSLPSGWAAFLYLYNLR